MKEIISEFFALHDIYPNDPQLIEVLILKLEPLLKDQYEAGFGDGENERERRAEEYAEEEYSRGYDMGYETGYDEGYNLGYDDGESSNF